MRKSQLKIKIYRVVDANFNRAKEGLRVCEDVCRFVYDDVRLTKKFKDLRHGLSSVLEKMQPFVLMRCRNIQDDVGKVSITNELKRTNIKDIVYANSQRVKESIRVLEEFAKLFDPKAAMSLKSLRYKIYALEQDLIKKADLYLILDTDVCGYEKLFEILKQSLSGGIDIVQLRDKRGKAKDTLSFAKKAINLLEGRVPFIVNDRIDIALAVQASGVHLGQDDVPISQARRMLGNNYLIGTSCQTIQQARKAEEAGADYIGFGSVFKTLTKPERSPMDLRLLEKVTVKTTVPVFAIGGISLKNISTLTALGVKRMAVCRDICLSANVKRTVQQFKKMLKE